MSSTSTKRLLELFEQELRALDTRVSDTQKRGGLRISRELEAQVADFAGEVRTQGSTPEQMLVDLKTTLAHAAPEIPTAQRYMLLAELTGCAIDAFYGRQPVGRQPVRDGR